MSDKVREKIIKSMTDSLESWGMDGDIAFVNDMIEPRKYAEVMADSLLTQIKDLVPEEMSGEYGESWDAGWNACRKEMLRRLG